MDSEEVLTDAEVDALMEGGEDHEDHGPETAGAMAGAIIDYDFAGQDHIVRGRMPVLELVNERFAQHFQRGLHSKLQRNAEVSAAPLRTVKFAEFVNSLGDPASLNSVSMQQLGGSALLVLEVGLVNTLVDLFFGGNGQVGADSGGREFSATEQRLIQLLLEQLVQDLKAAWAPVMAIDFEHLETAIDLQFTRIAGPKDLLVVCPFHVELEAGNSTFYIALPLTMLKPVSDLLDGGLQREKSGNEAQLLQGLKSNLQLAGVQLQATLLETQLRLRDVLDLKEGDVIPVTIPEQVTLLAEGVPMFHGQFGIHDGKNSVKVTMRIEDSEPSPGNN